MIRRGVVWAVAAALAVLLLAFAWHGYPAPGTDAPSFLVSAINLERGRGLVNPFYPQIAYGDPSGRNRHVYYPPLFPLALSALMPAATPRAAFLAVGVLRAASLGLAALLLMCVAARPGGQPHRTLAVVLSLMGLATGWMPTQGRPEALATLFVLMAALAAVHLRATARLAVLGCLLGLTGATQPMGAVQLGLVMLLGLAVMLPARAALGQAAAVAAIGLAVCAAVLALTPYGLEETLSGMARSYPHTPWTAPPGADWWRPWLTFRRSTFYGPLLLAAVAAGVHLLRGAPGLPRAKGPFLLAAAALTVCLYHGSLTHKSLRNYNALVLAPLFFALVVAWLARVPAVNPGLRAARMAALAVLAATGAGFAGHLAWFPWYLRHGRTLDEGRAAWRHMPVAPPQPVGLLGNLWPLHEDYDRVGITPVTDVGDPARAPAALVLGQRPEHGGRPPQLPLYGLVHDAFNPALDGRGLHRLFVAEDYSFALYVRR